MKIEIYTNRPGNTTYGIKPYVVVAVGYSDGQYRDEGAIGIAVRDGDDTRGRCACITSWGVGATTTITFSDNSVGTFPSSSGNINWSFSSHVVFGY